MEYTYAPTKRRYLVVSDLHLGDGSALEDFSHDKEFCELVQQEFDLAMKHSMQLELVLGGDIIDFLQIQPLGIHNAVSSLKKLENCIAAHPIFFDSLQMVVEQGHRITFLDGNHDFDFVLSNVWNCLIDRITGSNSNLVDKVARHLAYKLPEVYLEHGHQYDNKNRIDYERPILDQSGNLLLPWGSKFVIEVFNKVESNYQFIDKVKGYTSAALMLSVMDEHLTGESLLTFVGLNASHLEASSWKDFINTITRIAIGPRPTADVTGAKGGPTVGTAENTADIAMSEFLWELGQVADSLEILGESRIVAHAIGAKGVFADYGLKAQHKVYKFARYLSDAQDDLQKQDSLIKAARKLAQKHDVKYVIMGHTHGAREIKLSDDVTYINTGTWLPRLIMPHFATDQEFLAWLAIMRTSPEKYQRTSGISYVSICYENDRPLVSLEQLKLK